MWERALWEQSLLAIAVLQPTEVLSVTTSSRASFAPTGSLPQLFVVMAKKCHHFGVNIHTMTIRRILVSAGLAAGTFLLSSVQG
ncbi:hypothetical protein FHJ31_28190 [Pseudomonas sp. Fig-3]|nr:hypothetical protein FHJ31_28190 [Pseudomonas sp. Fig-3]